MSMTSPEIFSSDISSSMQMTNLEDSSASKPSETKPKIGDLTYSLNSWDKPSLTLESNYRVIRIYTQIFAPLSMQCLMSELLLTLSQSDNSSTKGLALCLAFRKLSVITQ